MKHEDKKWIKKRLGESNYNGCEYCFGNLFIWDSTYNQEVADYKGFLIAKALVENRVGFLFPAGSGDLKQVISDLAAYCANSGYPLTFGNITNDHKAVLDDLFPGAFFYTENRDASDYIYLRENLAILAGKKYHAKRNHIARFKDNPDWVYEPITAKNLDECYEMSMEWHKKYREVEDYESYQNELNAIRLAFEHFLELEFDGGLIRLNGSIAALTMGEQLNSDTYVIHIEKALPHIQGAYAIINQQFAQRVPEFIKYINREDDLGNEGLRRSKLSYHPEILLTKFDATLKPTIAPKMP
ncbi:MAG: phosphatidylglycerol lysyltransferase domain-containing protein [Spirochaetes bacterium]|nr:phosphatidylglycerol lysyltransferase domain-containing protein [Spirochaetota bacterium]